MSVKISVLGSTGSIGTQVLDVVRRLGPEKVQIIGLSAESNAQLLIDQAKEFRPQVVSIGKEFLYDFVNQALAESGVRVLSGPEGLEEVASLPEANKVVVSVAGTAGLAPTIRAIEAGKDIALASKEVLVAAGHIVVDLAKKHGVRLLPIDSEHSAILQCLNGESTSSVERVFLTASGGPLRNTTKEDMARITPEQALAHPTWKMGRKVTVDSATLMNKGLEIIEAKWLFGVSLTKSRW
jgi:1-deoxy-D-xylulose-5-phosphate reductoisomerase